MATFVVPGDELESVIQQNVNNLLDELAFNVQKALLERIMDVDEFLPIANTHKRSGHALSLLKDVLIAIKSYLDVISRNRTPQQYYCKLLDFPCTCHTC
jgi:hypothetical protein